MGTKFVSPLHERVTKNFLAPLAYLKLAGGKISFYFFLFGDCTPKVLDGKLDRKEMATITTKQQCNVKLEHGGKYHISR